MVHCMIVDDISTCNQVAPDHEFDIPKRKEPKRKFDTVSTSRNALQKGTLGVRWERARRNDSKMLLTSKMGIDIDP
ncbi:hypothetical protein DPMN_013120 [Dreissena polymorpha]|uniref:Uncharacterized protein n=1 Tax=Dreissena polymorpha TaxID=45954 RepID=A0A9D4N3P8_DREPO|nr:hypothetical protein DPMN_013120 [Dreissena polymorpha]